MTAESDAAPSDADRSGLVIRLLLLILTALGALGILLVLPAEASVAH